MANFIDANGDRQEVDLKGVQLHKEAADKKLSLRQLINTKYPTRAGDPDAFQQMCVNSGLRFKADDDHGIPAVNLKDILDPSVDYEAANQSGGNYTSSPLIPDSRILFPAALLEAVEDALEVNRSAAVSAFEDLVGYKKTIASNRYERPYISYGTKKGPEDSQYQRVAQNTRPPLMLSITASDVTQTIPTSSIGMEISHEAMAETSLDLVALTLTRFMQYADYNEWIAQMLLIQAGDPDGIVTPISASTSALASVKADVYDTDISEAGTLSQKAWLKYLYNKSMKMRKTHIVTDFDGAYALDNRTGRPTNVQDNGTDRMDVPFRVSYPDFNEEMKLVIMPSGSGWTADLMMGLDKAYALAKITSSTISYNAVEDLVMKKSREFRFDRGFVVDRLFDDAFDNLDLTLT